MKSIANNLDSIGSFITNDELVLYILDDFRHEYESVRCEQQADLIESHYKRWDYKFDVSSRSEKE